MKNSNHTCILEAQKSDVFAEGVYTYPKHPEFNHVDVWWDSLDGACPPNRYCILTPDRTVCLSMWRGYPDHWYGKVGE